MYISLKNKKVACGSQNMGVEILPNSLFPCGSHGGEEGGTGAYPGGIFWWGSPSDMTELGTYLER